MKTILILFVALLTANVCWGQNEVWFSVLSTSAHTETESGNLRFEIFQKLRTTSVIGIKPGNEDRYEISGYDRQGNKIFDCDFDYFSSSTELNNFFKFGDNVKNHIYSSYSGWFFSMTDGKYQAVCSKTLYDACHTSEDIRLGIKNYESRETHEGVKFVIRKSNEQYVIYKGNDKEKKLILRAEYNRIKQQEQAEEQAAKLAEELRKETERLAEEKRRKEYTDAFLKEHETKIYPFSAEAQQSNLTAIENAVKSVLDNIGTNSALPDISIIDNISVNYDRITNHTIVINGLKNPEIEQKLINAITQLDFAPETVTESYTQQQYSVNTEGIFTCNVSAQTYEKINAKKQYQSIIMDGNVPQDVQNAASTLMPFGGNYVLNLSRITINGKSTYDNSTVIKYHDTGGASNAFLSLLVPGLGDHKVTYGKNNGVSTAVSVYSLIGAGVGLKLYSNSEYKKYHVATEQTVMDKHYKSANYSNQAFYACVGTGALIWLYDIIRVWQKGAQNAKAAKTYKQSHLGVYYQPDVNATGLTYTINF
jgi:hypothetical protein